MTGELQPGKTSKSRKKHENYMGAFDNDKPQHLD